MPRTATRFAGFSPAGLAVLGGLETDNSKAFFDAHRADYQTGLLEPAKAFVEDLGDQYYRLEYFERTTAALRTVLLEKGLFTEAELKAKMTEVRARFDLPRESRSPAGKDRDR